METLSEAIDRSLMEAVEDFRFHVDAELAEYDISMIDIIIDNIALECAQEARYVVHGLTAEVLKKYYFNCN